MALPTILAKLFQPSAQVQPHDESIILDDKGSAGAPADTSAEGEISANLTADASGVETSAESSAGKDEDKKPKSSLATDGYARSWDGPGRFVGLLTGSFLTQEHGVNSRHNGGTGGFQFGLQFTPEANQRHVFGAGVGFEAGRVRRDLRPVGYSHANQFIPHLWGSYYFRAHDAVALGLDLALGVNVLRAKCDREDITIEKPVVGTDENGEETITYVEETLPDVCDQASGHAGNGYRAADLKAAGVWIRPGGGVKFFDVLKLGVALPLTFGAKNKIEDNAGATKRIPVTSGPERKGLRGVEILFAVDLAPLFYKAGHKNDESKSKDNGSNSTPPASTPLLTTDPTAGQVPASGAGEEPTPTDVVGPEVTSEPETPQAAFDRNIQIFKLANEGSDNSKSIKESYGELQIAYTQFSKATRESASEPTDVHEKAQNLVAKMNVLLNDYEEALSSIKSAKKTAAAIKDPAEKKAMLAELKAAEVQLKASSKSETLYEVAGKIYKLKSDVEKSYASYKAKHSEAPELETEKRSKPKSLSGGSSSRKPDGDKGKPGAAGKGEEVKKPDTQKPDEPAPSSTNANTDDMFGE